MKLTLKVTSILLLLIAGIILVLFLAINHFFFNINSLPEGEFLHLTESPNGDYTVNAYVSESGATVADAVRVEVVYHNKRDKTKNIYWGYRESEAKIIWIDNDTVSINGVELDVQNEVYDWRKE